MRLSRSLSLSADDGLAALSAGDSPRARRRASTYAARSVSAGAGAGCTGGAGVGSGVGGAGCGGVATGGTGGTVIGDSRCCATIGGGLRFGTLGWGRGRGGGATRGRGSTFAISGGLGAAAALCGVSWLRGVS